MSEVRIIKIISRQREIAMHEHEKEYLTQHEVAELLNVKVTTLNHWRSTKKYDIPYIKFGGVILYPTEKFYEWLESNGHNLTPESSTA